jgi:DNA-3-methyladenine glycosylase II
MIISFTQNNFTPICKKLAKKDTTIKFILKTYGYPPIYNRKPSFETLVHIILEQQVSLASAKAALVKLKEKIGLVTPVKLLALSDEELRSCYFSRQKIIYTRTLAAAIVNKQISLKSFTTKPDDAIRNELIQLKGIGNWTIDVYLMMVLQRTDLFPIGDIALVNSIKHEMQLPKTTTKEALLDIATAWKPYRTIASFIFWHAYIKRKGIRL